MDNQVIVIDKLSEDLNFTVKESEKKTFVIFLTGEGDQSGKVLITIKGSNADVKILGMIIGQDSQKINLFTLQDHKSPASVSDLFIKSVLFGSSRFFYEGLIKIAPKAAKSNAYQKNQNLLLGATAWADSRPKLEILANDVRCTHGATIGKINQEILYYLKTRGISEKKSETLVIEGFFREVLDRIPDKNIRELLSKEIILKINKNLLN